MEKLYEEIMEDIEREFSGCSDSYTDRIITRHGRHRLEPKILIMQWRIRFMNEIELFAKGIQDDDLNPRKFPFLKHNVNIILNDIIPSLRSMFVKHYSSSKRYYNNETLRVHLLVKEVLNLLLDVEATYIEALHWSK